MKKLSATILAAALMLSSVIFTACSDNSVPVNPVPENEDEMINALQEDYQNSVDDLFATEELTSVDQLKKYGVDYDSLTEKLKRDPWRMTSRMPINGNLVIFSWQADTVNRVLTDYVCCEVSKADNTIHGLFIPAEFTAQGTLKYGDNTEDASYDKLYGMIHLGSEQSISHSGDISWVGALFVEAVCEDKDRLYDTLTEFMYSDEHSKYDASKYDYIKLGL